MKLDHRAIRDQAERELRDESFRAAVDAEKQRLLSRKPFWHRLVPSRIIFKRR